MGLQVPRKLADLSAGCNDLHPDWEYHFWDDIAFEKLIVKHFPDMLEMYPASCCALKVLRIPCRLKWSFEIHHNGFRFAFLRRGVIFSLI